MQKPFAADFGQGPMLVVLDRGKLKSSIYATRSTSESDLPYQS